MTDHLTDEQLNEFELYLQGYESSFADDVRELITALRAERAAHQATRAELEQLRELYAAVRGFLEGPMNKPDVALLIEAYREVYDTARAGQGEGA